MNTNFIFGLPSLVFLQSFSVFPEYFISVSLIYVLIVVVLITYKFYGFMLQKTVSECIAIILLMSCYLILNDDLVIINFLNFNNSIINDSFGVFTKFIVCLASSVYFLIIANSLKEHHLTSFEYLLIILFSSLGLMILCSSNDFLTAYLALELASLSCYLLASFKITSTYSIEGGIKYFIIGSVSSAFFLLGSSLIYGFSGSINFLDFYDIFEASQISRLDYFYLICPVIRTPEEFLTLLDLILWTYNSEPTPEFLSYNFAELGLSLILFSLFIKLALAPFHLWSLDVYEGSPTSATFFFAVISKLSIFVLLVRLCYTCFIGLYSCWAFYSLWVGVFSIFVGSFGGLKQRKLKTLLAYSSTSHMGYILITLSTITFFGVQMLLFYLLIYIITGLITWSILLFLRLKKKGLNNKYNKELGDLVLLKKSNSVLAFTFTLTMFSITGIPPMIGFIAKMNVFLSVINDVLYLAALFSILFSVVSTFYYIRIIKVLYFENALVGQLYYPIDNDKTSILSITAFLLIFLFINPTILYLIIYKVSFCFKLYV
jgi:NADH-quinone oxidoreductase subunit N